MSDVKLSLTQSQYVMLMSIVGSLPRALSGVSDAADEDDARPDTPITESGPATPLDDRPPSEVAVNLEPELAVVKNGAKDAPEIWTTLDFVFSVGVIALEVYTGEAHSEQDLQQNSIARFALTQSHVGMKQLSDGAMEAEFSLQALSFANTRAGKSVFRDIIPSAEHQGKQV
jgi:vacuolar protein sorting-associated protein 13A/C